MNAGCLERSEQRTPYDAGPMLKYELGPFKAERIWALSINMDGWACEAVPAVDVFSFTLQRIARLSPEP